jgi:hypothetical protein
MNLRSGCYIGIVLLIGIVKKDMSLVMGASWTLPRSMASRAIH